MTGRFTVLASGSSGNAALLEASGFGLLIDCGLHPRTLTQRLRTIGAKWEQIHAVILTHTHGDHWKDHTLADLRTRRIPLFAHEMHHEQLALYAESYDTLRRAGLVRLYHDRLETELAPGLFVKPVRVSHDADPTFGFRIEQRDEEGVAWAIGYVSDLGCGSEELIEAFAGVDVLAMEFNHDPKLERASRRPKVLVDRVLGDFGHLSNAQAGELAAQIASRSGEGFPSHLVQLHLSRECNRPVLASAVGHAALAALNPRVEVITAQQDAAAKSISLVRRSLSAERVAPRKSQIRRTTFQPHLPGFETQP